MIRQGLRTYTRLRSYGTLGRRQPKPRTFGEVPKRLGLSAVDKGPWRSEAHLARVRKQPCLGCGRSGVDAHHCRKLLGPGWGQPPDWCAVPLCRSCHDEAHEGPEGERGFWRRKHAVHIKFIREFSAEGAKGLERLRNMETVLR